MLQLDDGVLGGLCVLVEAGALLEDLPDCPRQASVIGVHERRGRDVVLAGGAHLVQQHLGPGRTVASEREAPINLANLV